MIGFANNTGSTVTNSYWDIQTSGKLTSAGGTGLTTAQLKSGALPTGFDPSVWSASVGHYPVLQSAHDMFVSGFNSLGAAYLNPSVATSLTELQQSQQFGLALMNSTLALAQNLGTPPPSEVLQTKVVNALNKTKSGILAWSK